MVGILRASTRTLAGLCAVTRAFAVKILAEDSKIDTSHPAVAKAIAGRPALPPNRRSAKRLNIGTPQRPFPLTPTLSLPPSRKATAGQVGRGRNDFVGQLSYRRVTPPEFITGSTCQRAGRS